MSDNNNSYLSKPVLKSMLSMLKERVGTASMPGQGTVTLRRINYVDMRDAVAEGIAKIPVEERPGEWKQYLTADELKAYYDALIEQGKQEAPNITEAEMVACVIIFSALGFGNDIYRWIPDNTFFLKDDIMLLMTS